MFYHNSGHLVYRHSNDSINAYYSAGLTGALFTTNGPRPTCEPFMDKASRLTFSHNGTGKTQIAMLSHVICLLLYNNNLDLILMSILDTVEMHPVGV